MNGATNYVYRAFDDHGVLLYVGCTNDLARRMAAHRSQSDWYGYMKEYSAEGPYGRDEALWIEARAIRDERPAFNAQPEHTKLVQANRNEATRLLCTLVPGDDRGTDWYAARNAIGRLIRDDFPVIDETDRLDAYLAIRSAVSA